MKYLLQAAGRRGAIYSCDKLVLGFKALGRNAQHLLDWLGGPLAPEFSRWESRRLGTFRDQFSISCTGGGTFWLGVGLNTAGAPDWKAIRLEFNPNKVGDTPEFSRVWSCLLGCTVGRTRLVRWDLAVDFPVPLESCVLVKDRRLYEEVRHSAADRTQYLGQRNSSGRCKLYNKQLEQGLPEPLTRIELTLDLEDSTRERAGELWPVVYTAGAADCSGLNDTDAFILRTLVQAPERINELGRRKRDKLAPLLAASNVPLPFDADAFDAVVRQISGMLWGGNADMVDFVPALGETCPAWGCTAPAHGPELPEGIQCELYGPDGLPGCSE